MIKKTPTSSKLYATNTLYKSNKLG